MTYKARKHISGELEEFLSGFAPNVREWALQLRDLVLEMETEAIEQIDIPAHLLAYGYAKTYKHLICVIILYKDYVNLGFPRGTELPDPKKLLEGTGKKARHIKIKTAETITDAALRKMLLASMVVTPRADE